MPRQIIGDSGCPSCIQAGRDRTRNHLIHFSDGYKYCNRCGYSENGGISDTLEEIMEQLPSTEIADRKLSAATVKNYRVGVEYSEADGSIIAHHYPVTKNGVVTGYKVRKLPKTFVSAGDCKGVTELFGQFVVPAGGKKLLITGGELDCLSSYQMLYERYPNFKPSVVSLPKGENTAAIKDNLEYINSFSEVLIYTDMDDVGRKTADNIAALIGFKARIVSTSEKDASDMLMAGKSAEFINAFFNAVPRKPKGIVSGNEITLERLKIPSAIGYATPYPVLNGMLGGLRKGELTTVTAGSGIGKSTLIRELAYHLRAVHGLIIGNISLEEKIEKTVNGYIAIDNNVPLSILCTDANVISGQKWENSYNNLIKTGWFGLDHFGSLPTDELIDKMRFLAYGEHCDFILLDHLSMVFSGQDMDNERKAIDLAMTQLAAFAVESGVGIIVVVHLSRKAGKTSFNEGGQISLTDLRGSAALEQLSFNVIALERSQQALGEEARNTSVIRVLKCRETGVTGLADTCKYNTITGRLLPISMNITGDY